MDIVPLLRCGDERTAWGWIQSFMWVLRISLRCLGLSVNALTHSHHEAQVQYPALHNLAW